MTNLYLIVNRSFIGLPRWLSGKESACSTGDEGDIGSIPEPENNLEEEMATQ